MATESVCGKLRNGQDSTCVTLTRRYYQEAVLINRSDILTKTITVPTADATECVYTIEFALKEGATGYRFKGSDNGSVFKGYFDKSTSDLGQPQYVHNVQMLIVGADQETKCILDSLGKGSYVVALQFDDTIEIYGAQSGLVAGDYTYDVQEGGGGAPIVLSSLEVSPESLVPLIYVSGTPGSEVADFDAAFENAAPSV